MMLKDLIEYLKRTGWTESAKFADHYEKVNTNGIVAVDHVANEAYIVEYVGDVPWARISDLVQFEKDLSHLQ